MATTRSEIETVRLRGRWSGLAALTASGLVLGLDITILITALPTLSAKLSATTDQLQWMSAAYTLSLAGFMLPAGVLRERADPDARDHGRQRRHRPPPGHLDPAVDVR